MTRETIYVPTVDARGVSFAGQDLTGRNFRRALLFGANFERASLVGVNLRGADCRRTNFDGADLTWANTTGADFRQASLRDIVGLYNHRDIAAEILAGSAEVHPELYRLAWWLKRYPETVTSVLDFAGIPGLTPQVRDEAHRILRTAGFSYVESERKNG